MPDNFCINKLLIAVLFLGVGADLVTVQQVVGIMLWGMEKSFRELAASFFPVSLLESL